MTTGDRRIVLFVNLTVCESGHIADAEPAGNAWQVRCGLCGEWTWEDGRFCIRCGSSTDPERKLEKLEDALLEIVHLTRSDADTAPGIAYRVLDEVGVFTVVEPGDKPE